MLNTVVYHRLQELDYMNTIIHFGLLQARTKIIIHTIDTSYDIVILISVIHSQLNCLNVSLCNTGVTCQTLLELYLTCFILFNKFISSWGGM